MPSSENVNDFPPIRRHRGAKANPYVARVYEFSDRVFTFEDFEADREKVGSLLSEASDVICELGSGSGNHLIELGIRNPQGCVIGFELRYKRAVRTVEKARARGVENVFVLKTDSFWLARILPRQSLNQIFINFPDPWEKRRSHKHRLLSANMLDLIRLVLKPGGQLSIKTDHGENYNNFLSILSAAADFRVIATAEDLHSSEYRHSNIVTEFESMFKGLNKPIYLIRAIFGEG